MALLATSSTDATIRIWKVADVPQPDEESSTQVVLSEVPSHRSLKRVQVQKDQVRRMIFVCLGAVHTKKWFCT